MENLIPSMDFQPGVPSRGKPKKKRKGAPTFNNRTASLAMDRPSPLIGISTSRKRPSDQVLTEEPQTKRRGRPKGAKNKNTKDSEVRVDPSSLQNDEICCTCHLGLKFRNKIVVKCSRCGIKIHKACLKGLNGCQNCELIPDSSV